MTPAKVLNNVWVKRCALVLGVVPAVLLYLHWRNHELGANWVEAAQHRTGTWALRFLVATLFITPLRKIPGLNLLIRYRRMLGLFSFFYACIHLWIYLQFDKAWYWVLIKEDFTQRWFFMAGAIAFVSMIPLALTSTQWAIRKLGGVKWQWIHRLIYVSAMSAAIHYKLQGKSFVPAAAGYVALVAVLLLYRLVMYLRRPAPALHKVPA